jgi:hypothetical protein
MVALQANHGPENDRNADRACEKHALTDENGWG